MRTEHVGSLQRPEELMQARLRAMIGKITPEELHALENEAIDDASGSSARPAWAS